MSISDLPPYIEQFNLLAANVDQFKLSIEESTVLLPDYRELISNIESFMGDDGLAFHKVLDYLGIDLDQLVKWENIAKQNSGYNVDVLHDAVMRQDLETMQDCLAHNVEPTFSGKDGRSFLLISIFKGNPDMVADLIEAGADVSEKGGMGDTYLMTALRHGNDDVSELFMRPGVDLHAVNDYGDNALTIAERHGSRLAGKLKEAGVPSIRTQAVRMQTAVGTGAPVLAGG